MGGGGVRGVGGIVGKTMTVLNTKQDCEQASETEVLVAVRGLRTYFALPGGFVSRRKRWLKAVDGVSFEVRRGRTLGLVGESGCGKTTLGRTMLRLIPATAGSVLFEGRDLLSLPGKAMRAMRRHVQIIFQDPVGSLNPRMTVGSIVGEPLTVHRIARGRELRDRVAELLERVGLSPAHMSRYPHEFSGGQRQRIGIARAIALRPKFIVCDEPVSALDVSIQSQILNLLADLGEEYGLTYLLIAHHLGLIRHCSDEVAVMYLGRIVEIGPSQEVYEHPAHPYTQALLASAPVPDPTQRKPRIALPGEVPSPSDPPSGCAFHPRCPFAREQCMAVEPVLERKAGGSAGHLTACHFADEGLSFVDAMQKAAG